MTTDSERRHTRGDDAVAGPARRGTGLGRRTLVLAAGSSLLLGAAAAPPRPRVVSLNPCLDAILVQIAAVSHWARDPEASGIVEVARTLPITYESAEEVVALRPDLVLTSQHSSPATREALRQLGVATALFKVPSTVADSVAQVRRIAGLVGHPDRGEALIARIEAALRRAAPPPGFRPITALVFQPNGFAAGHGTLVDDMLRRTGFINVAERYGIGQWGNVALERLLDAPPQVLLSGRSAADAGSWGERIVSHPALQSLGGRMVQVAFPERLLYCGGPNLIDSAAALAGARRQVMARRA